MVVHPARGHWSGTLTSALAFHFQQLSTVGGAHRPGVVHRLDRDTSGVMVVAKTDHCHYRLAEQFADRTTEKEYFALTVGSPDRDQDRIEQPIGMHPTHRVRMAIRADHSTSRDATTFYEVVERFDGFAAVKGAAQDGADASDSGPPGSHRLFGTLRQALRRPGGNHPRRDPPRSQGHHGSPQSTGPYMPCASSSGTPRRSSRLSSPLRCRQIWRGC